MPELPEVETVVRDLRPLLTGRRVTGLSTAPTAFKLRLPWNRGWAKTISGRTFAGARRRGKWIMLDFADGGVLLVHLGMTGQLTVVPTASDRGRHCHVEMRLDDEPTCLRFRDSRRFGGVRYVADEATVQAYFGERLGPEPWDLDPAAWHRRLTASRRPLKAILLDQTVVAGVGNIYADEALHLARLVPTQKGSDTTRPQANRLRGAIVAVLERAIAARGSTIRDYVGGSGLEGGFQHQLSVYGRKGEPCSSCRAVILCIRLAGRSTHFCPQCQKSASRAPSRERPAPKRKTIT
jgi:formamidopyrimidine-DNA glycosylase